MYAVEEVSCAAGPNVAMTATLCSPYTLRAFNPACVPLSSVRCRAHAAPACTTVQRRPMCHLYERVSGVALCAGSCAKHATLPTTRNQGIRPPSTTRPHLPLQPS